MKLGPVEVFFRRRPVVEAAARNYLLGPEVSALIAKMARSEVKNYLAELAEKAEMPFHGADGFLRDIQLVVMGHLMGHTHEDRLRLRARGHPRGPIPDLSLIHI